MIRPRNADCTRPLAFVTRYGPKGPAIGPHPTHKQLDPVTERFFFPLDTTTVLRRPKTIRDKTGLAPAQMRRLSPHLAKLEDAATDPRAAHIHRKRLINDDQDTE